MREGKRDGFCLDLLLNILDLLEYLGKIYIYVMYVYIYIYLAIRP